jgi:predicted hotdog family 3-hydroxylacyl-ACP dehydratase
MNPAPWPVSQLLPHAGAAILIDSVDEWDEETLRATAVVRADGPYSGEDGSLPPWMGLEIMAQAVGAWAGCHARHAGMDVGLGFLLGTRRYECHAPCFLPGTRLSVHVTRSLQDAGGMGVFECTLHAGGALLAHARLNVYRPADASAFTREAAPPDDGTPMTGIAPTQGDATIPGQDRAPPLLFTNDTATT